MGKEAKIWFTMAFFSALIGYSLHPYLWDYAFYHLTTFAFVGYVRVIYLMSTGKWKTAALVVWITTLNSLYDEIIGDPFTIELNELVTVLLMIFITLNHYKKWINLTYYSKN